MLMMTLPGDRLSFYETSNVSEMRKNIGDVTDKIINALGFFPAVADT